MGMFETLFLIGLILVVVFWPQIKSYQKRKEYDNHAKIMKSLGYHYDWERYNQIQNEVRDDRCVNPEKYPTLHEYGKEINRRCEKEKLLNKSDLERK